METRYLGNQTNNMPADPDTFEIDCVPSPDPSLSFLVRFTCPEFTSLCPKTGQPDFATIVIDYVPRKLLVESKALKLYLASFRNHGAFHETCITSIGQKLVAAAKPDWMRVAGFFYPRGGIPIDVVITFGRLDPALNAQPLDMHAYRGR